MSTQVVIALLLQLQKGQIPDLVIFYDGVNDMYSAYQQKVAGLPENEFNRVKEFNLSQPAKSKQLRRMALEDVARRLSRIRFIKELLRKGGVWREPAVAAHPIPLDNLALGSKALARDVLAT